jgi:O-antigen/teichoic acid export membrane protein
VPGSSSRFRPGGARLALLVRLGGRGVTFLVAIWLARILGSEGYGIYAFATAVVAVLFAISGLGFGGVLLRQTALYRTIGRPDLISELVRKARRTVLALAAASSSVAAVGALLFVDPVFVATLLVALPAVLVLGSNLIWQGVLQGLGQIEESFVATYVVYPLAMVVGIGLLLVVSGGVSPEQAASLYLASFSIGALVIWRVGRSRLEPVLRQEASTTPIEEWQTPVLGPFTALAFITSIEGSLGIVLLGLFGLPDAVADLQVSVKLIEPVTMVFMVLSLSLAPRLASRFAEGRISEIQPRVTRNVKFSLIAALPVGLLLILGRDSVLRLFGSGFEEASVPLVIMVSAALFNVFTGMSGAALTMSRYWTPAIAAKSLGLVLNLALSLTLIPQLGATGAAIGFATGIVVANSVMAWRAWTLLHLDTTALALVFRRAG